MLAVLAWTGNKIMPAPLHLRVFISSPGDVGDERNLARRLLKDELPYDAFLRGKVTLDPVSWDDPAAPTPMVATLTPQEAVNRFGCRPSECDIVIVVLWSRLGTHLDLSKFSKPNGEPYLSGTEYEYEEAVSAKKPPDILVYRRTERVQIYADDPQFDDKRAQYTKAQAFFDRFKNRNGSFRGSFTEYATPTDFVSRLEKDLISILQQRLEAAQQAPATAADVQPRQASSPVWEGSPYPGLRPFDFTEAAIFFGRGRETDALIARLRDPNQRFLAVLGASGSGKSSLVRAGLLPRLLEGAIEGGQHWCVLTLTPGAAGKDPFLALAVELVRALPPSTRKPAIKIAEALAHAPQRITDYAATILAGRPAGAVLALVVDQLEELFTLATTSHPTGFLDLLAHAAGDPRLRVLATLRADFLSQAVAEPILRLLLQAPAGTYVLAPPDPLALAEMIFRPAERAGLEIEDDVVHEVLKDAGTDPGALPLVAFCLEELYRSSAPAHRLTAAAYNDLGRLRGAIGRRAEALLSNLQKTEGAALEAALPTLFHALVHVDAAGTVTRRRTFRNELAIEPPLPRVIETLVEGRLLRAEDASGRATITVAHEALLAAWPALHEWVEANRAQLQRFHRLCLSLAFDNPLEDRRHAVKELSGITTVMPEAVPTLVTALGDTDGNVRREASAALVKIGSEAVPALIAALGDADGNVRWEASAALGKIGPAPAEAVPALIAALGDADGDVRWEASAALGEIGPAAAEAVPALIAALGDADGDVRREASAALGEIGPAPAEAVPALIATLGDADGNVRREASAALGKIGSEAVPALTAALADADGNVRWEASAALGKIGPAAAEAVPALIAVLADADGNVRREASAALGKIGSEAVPALTAALADADGNVRWEASAALGKIGSEAVPALTAALADADGNVRQKASAALGKIGSEAVPALTAALADADGNVRQKASTALVKIGSEAVSALTAALADADGNVRQKASTALVKIGSEAVSALTAALADADGNVRWGAAAALGKIGPAAAEAVPALIAVLADADWNVRREASAALGKIGPAAVEAVPALIAALGDADVLLRLETSAALRKIGSAES